MSLFSKNLRFLRKRGSYNQDEISILFNKKANTIGNWENQKSEPSLAELMKLGDYFKVSVQELLYSDLEAQSFQQNTEAKTSDSFVQIPKSYSLQEPVNSMASEGSEDAFWVILRELRSMNEKLDLLASRLDLSTLKMNSDKSSH
ncbi:MAG TPA: helix-turn-helix transcriptional regulator [Puia sp.]|jgi:transcriptional regulator with XRE-family HTH domain|nr:helix-turn-helix transcriptional regulator [Puia sp.]